MYVVLKFKFFKCKEACYAFVSSEFWEVLEFYKQINFDSRFWFCSFKVKLQNVVIKFWIFFQESGCLGLKLNRIRTSQVQYFDTDDRQTNRQTDGNKTPLFWYSMGSWNVEKTWKNDCYTSLAYGDRNFVLLIFLANRANMVTNFVIS